MKKITPLILCFLFPVLLSATSSPFGIRNGLPGRWRGNFVMQSATSGFSLWMNDKYALGGGVTIEYGQSWPLLAWNRQLFLMLDVDVRLAAIKKTTAGAGATVAGELRFYNRSRNIADYGLEASWGINGMAYINGYDNELGHLLYGSNWMRLGYIDVHSRLFGGDTEYFAQFQYWNGNWYTMCGLSVETFKTKHLTRHVRMKF